ncbi:MAG: hypothetical protein P4L58_01890, partial [Candidatus Pacebacteria bacterium]|nr:hypothetical protein [Candidatus Paceibacterota bacterium]
TPENPFRHRFDSHGARKIILLFLIVLVLFFDLVILGWSKMIAREFKPQQISQNLPTPMERNIGRMTRGYPIEKMTPLIARQNKTTAAFLVSVAKQESDWGNHVPVLDGQDCYNYWGFRGQSVRMSHDGFTCFDNPQQAVNTVAKRFNNLINNSSLDTPQEMVVWECGHDCANRSSQETSTWINGVSYYFDKLCPNRDQG